MWLLLYIREWRGRGTKLIRNERIEAIDDNRFVGGKALAVPMSIWQQEPLCKTCRNIFDFPKCCTENISECFKIIGNCGNYVR